MTVMIDTLKFAKNFETAGFATPQAEALTAALAEMNTATRDDLVTKSDLQTLRNEVLLGFAGGKADLQVAVAALKTEIATINATTRSQLLWAMFGGQFVIIGVLIALSKFAHLFA